MPPRRSAERATIEESLVAINSELESLEKEEVALRGARILLATARNKSVALAPVNKLPPEILARVFALSRSYCILSDTWNLAEFYDLTAISTYWRQTAMNATDLWAHIDVGPETPLGLVNLLFERTKDHAVHVHVCEPELRQHQSMLRDTTEKTIDILTSHIHRVCTLDVSSDTDFYGLPIQVLTLWLGHGSATLSRFLRICNPYDAFSISHNENSGDETVINRFENANSMLRSIRTLHLQNVDLDENSGAYRNLIDLRLVFDSIPISISELAGILSASPALVVLKLRLSIASEEAWNCPTPIQLDCLKVLNLLGVKPDAGPLLSLIAPPRLSTEFSVSLPGFERTHDELLEFFGRTQVTAFYYSSCDTGYTFSLWSLLLSAFHRLSTLVLRQFNMSDAETTPVFPRSGLPTRLPFVVLLESIVTLEGLGGLVGEYGIQDLRLEMCHAPESDQNGLEGIRTSLLGIYPELRCHISDVDSTWDSPCRIMLD